METQHKEPYETALTGSCKEVVLTFDDRTIVIRQPLGIAIHSLDNFKKGPQLFKMQIEYLSEDATVGVEKNPEPVEPRECGWCHEDITMIPEDSNNCCYCGGPLNEEENEESEDDESKDASEEPGESDDYFFNVAPQVAFLRAALLDKQSEEIDLTSEVKEITITPESLVYYTKLNPETGKYVLDYYGNNTE